MSTKILWGKKVPPEWNGTYKDPFKTIPEKTDFKKTSSFLETCEFISELMWHTELMHVERMFITELRRAAPLIILSNPRVTSPDEARRLGKPVVYLQGGIHPDEAEGKEAIFFVMRELLFGKLKHLLNNLVVACCPDFNPDGNDAWTVNTSSGGIGVRGQRGNFYGLDLNRDAIKLESPNMKGLCNNLLNRWDPIVSLDLHCMGPVQHAYALLYAPSYTPTAHPDPRTYTSDVLFPAVRNIVRDKFNLEVYTHAEWDKKDWPPKTWDPKRAFYTVEAKYIANAIGLRNRLSILTETPSQPGFEKRIYSSYAYICALLEYTSNNHIEIENICKKADEEVVKSIREKSESHELKNWVEGEYARKGYTDLYVYKNRITKLIPGTSFVFTGSEDTEPILIEGVEDLTLPIGTKESTFPRGYLIPEELNHIIDKIRIHGIKVDLVTEPVKAHGEEFVVDSFSKQQKGDHTLYPMTELLGGFKKTSKTFPSGTYKIDLAQPLANLAFYCLEPEISDGFSGWGLLDDFLKARGAPKFSVVYPIFKYFKLQ
ncbi:hypothetical protein JW865_05480 [Candidatus Bathyarchaeota archaeon]|nr:hypothetical protein [Candidatus Bathyarchaeota archaeon]